MDRARPDKGRRLNDRIRCKDVRVIMNDEQLGVMPTYQALKLAVDNDLDLVEISPLASPPVCLVVNYGKYKYDEEKKKSSSRGATTETKEIKFTPKTDEHDVAFKVRHIRQFIEDGNKVRLVVVFKGREMAHPDTGSNMLTKVIELCADVAKVETESSMEGKKMMAVIAPRPHQHAQPKEVLI